MRKGETLEGCSASHDSLFESVKGASAQRVQSRESGCLWEIDFEYNGLFQAKTGITFRWACRVSSVPNSTFKLRAVPTNTWSAVGSNEPAKKVRHNCSHSNKCRWSVLFAPLWEVLALVDWLLPLGSIYPLCFLHGFVSGDTFLDSISQLNWTSNGFLCYLSDLAIIWDSKVLRINLQTT